MSLDRQPLRNNTETTDGKTTICVVNYRTLDLTRLCLRSLRKFTDGPYEILVVDNDSQDASQEYLRSLSWIRLIERHPPRPDPNGSFAHGAALDLGLANCRTEFFVSLHSDTVILQEGWLSYLVQHFAGDPQVACVGTGKIELKPAWQQWLTKNTNLKALVRTLLAGPEKKLRFRYFNTTICSAYRTDVLRRENLSFHACQDRRLTVGRELYFALQARGYQTIALPPQSVGQYVAHLAHATQALHGRHLAIGGGATRKYRRRAAKVLRLETVQALLSDSRLDE